MPLGTRRDSSRRRAVALGVGTIVAIALLAIALVFSNAYGAERVAANARAQHWTNATAGAASIARASNAQAVFFAVDHELGVASTEGRDRALREARTNMDALREWALDLEPLGDIATQGLTTDLQNLLDLGDEVLDLLEAEAVTEALQLSSTGFEEAYVTLSADLARTQAEIAERIDSTEAVAAAVAGLTRLLVTVLIPIAALVIYRVLIKRQVEQRRVAMEAKLTAERELRHAKDEFIASISHEIRTPLTSIYGFSEVLVESGIVDPDMTEELIGMIHQESAELSRMVEDLLTAARLDALALTFSYENALVVDEVELVLIPFRRSGIEVSVDLPPTDIRVDRLRFRQIIRNLVSNAAKHGAPPITIGGLKSGSSLIMHIEDRGSGVPEDVRDRMFDPFVHRGEQPLLVGSVGLGLAVARTIAQEMGGDLRYEREDITRFVLEIPLAAPAIGTGTSASPLDTGIDIAASTPDGYTGRP